MDVSFINGIGGAAESVSLKSGSFDITLANGGAGSLVSISSDWNASTARGTYVVAVDDEIDELSVSSLAIGGSGSVKDIYGNGLSATPTIPPGSNLEDDRTFKIDGVAPTIVSIRTTDPNSPIGSPAGTPYGIDDYIDIDITFSESVELLTSSLDLVLSSGKTLSVPAFTPHALTKQVRYTVAETEQTDLLEVTGTPTLAGSATLRDDLDDSPNDMADFTIPGAGNISETRAIKIDGIRPFVQSVTSF